MLLTSTCLNLSGIVTNSKQKPFQCSPQILFIMKLQTLVKVIVVICKSKDYSSSQFFNIIIFI